MNLLETIQYIWETNTRLASLLPASSDQDVNKVHTGRNFTPELPFAILEKTGGSPEMYDNCDSGVDLVNVRVQIFAEDYDEGEEILDAVKAAFDRTHFDLYWGSSSSSGEDIDKVLNMQRTQDSALQEPDGVWRFVIDFDAWVYLVNGY